MQKTVHSEGNLGAPECKHWCTWTQDLVHCEPSSIFANGRIFQARQSI